MTKDLQRAVVLRSLFGGAGFPSLDGVHFSSDWMSSLVMVRVDGGPLVTLRVSMDGDSVLAHTLGLGFVPELEVGLWQALDLVDSRLAPIYFITKYPGVVDLGLAGVHATPEALRDAFDLLLDSASMITSFITTVLTTPELRDDPYRSARLFTKEYLHNENESTPDPDLEDAGIPALVM